MNSMTSFSSHETQQGTYIISCDVKTVNHRYLDISCKLPEQLRSQEFIIRQNIKKRIHRGKVDCHFRIFHAECENSTIIIDNTVAQELLDAVGQLEQATQLQNDIKLSHILSWPGIISTKEFDDKVITKLAFDVLEQTLSKTLDMRQQEGLAISRILLEKLDHMMAHVATAQNLVMDNKSQARTKLNHLLEELGVTADNNRIEQEIALSLNKMDVTEELDRLNVHLTEVHRVLQMKEPIGRRLDFLMQELNREANTLSSKSTTAQLTACAVEIKVLIEQMREQIQNIE